MPTTSSGLRWETVDSSAANCKTVVIERAGFKAIEGSETFEDIYKEVANGTANEGGHPGGYKDKCSFDGDVRVLWQDGPLKSRVAVCCSRHIGGGYQDPNNFKAAIQGTHPAHNVFNEQSCLDDVEFVEAATVSLVSHQNHSAALKSKVATARLKLSELTAFIYNLQSDAICDQQIQQAYDQLGAEIASVAQAACYVADKSARKTAFEALKERYAALQASGIGFFAQAKVARGELPASEKTALDRLVDSVHIAMKEVVSQAQADYQAECGQYGLTKFNERAMRAAARAVMKATGLDETLENTRQALNTTAAAGIVHISMP